VLALRILSLASANAGSRRRSAAVAEGVLDVAALPHAGRQQQARILYSTSAIAGYKIL